MEKIKPPQKELAEATIEARKRYVLFAIIAFIFIVLALVLLMLAYPESIIKNPIIDVQDVRPVGNVNNNGDRTVDDAIDRTVDNAIDNGASNNAGIIAIFRGDAPVPSELNITLNQYIDRYLYGCYYIQSDSEKIDCYGVYYFNVDNPVKEQYDICIPDQNRDSNQQNPNQECMDKVYSELASYVGKFACARIFDIPAREECVERAE